MNKIKKTNMNIKKITIAMLITLISIGNINAQEMKTEIPKISEFPTGNENTGFEQYFSDKTNYYVSVGHMSQDAMIVNYGGFKRTNV